MILGVESLRQITEKLQLISIWVSFLNASGGLIPLCGLLVALHWWFTSHLSLYFPEPFLFLDLPAQIRFMIYEKLLCAKDKSINICDYNIDLRTLICPSILCVNILIYSEATPVLYDCNSISIHYSYDSL